MKVKIEIKNYWTGRVLFEYEKENNTIKSTLIEAVKSGVDLRGADLQEANLCGAYLCDADLRNADLSNADIRGANFHGAVLCDVKEIPYIPISCPSDGAFVGWKKIGSYLIKLEIPEDARRSSTTTSKCRCDKAKVLAITDFNEENSILEVTNNSYVPTIYKVGEMVYSDSFDEDRWNECSHGIHFFINKQEAINY